MIGALLVVETALLVLLLVLVAGLLRSHAEILRRLGAGERPAVPAPEGLAAARVPSGAPAPGITGTTPAGDAIVLSFEGQSGSATLLAFLTSGCGTCARFWEGLGEQRLPAGVQPIVVTRGTEREQPARVRRLARGALAVVMSSPAWEDYGVPGAPYFVLVEGTVRGEGMASSWTALASLIGDAIEDARSSASPAPGEARAARSVDDAFAAAGIGPDHPSLYPGGRQPG
jgi:hypothetical protein